ncbi:MAG: hypothetical protein AAB676_15250 [Verrucomicrobiota bacterium]
MFREFTYHGAGKRGAHFPEWDPGSEVKTDWRGTNRQPRFMEIDLSGAIRAEMIVEYWGGHIGTVGQMFRVNGGQWSPYWVPIPQPQGTPTDPQRYFRTVLGTPPVPIPLSNLKNGTNSFRFTAGPQIAYGFDWGFFWVYDFTVRVYYDAALPHPTGEIVLPASGARLGESPTITIRARSGGAPIKQVDVLGYYDDFNWSGDGLFREWHCQRQYGVLKHHIGTATAAPYVVTWDTSWVPDQTQPMKLIARITDERGVTTMTPVVENVRLSRRTRSVKMFTSGDMPEAFGVRVGQRKSCTFNVTSDLRKAKSARIVLSTWSGQHADEVGINQTKLADRVGVAENYGCDAVEVPVSALKKGINTFYMFSKTKEHAAEVNWPGPVLFVEYAR